MQIDVNQMKRGVNLDLGDGIYCVVDTEHVKPGKGGAFIRAKLKDIASGAVIERMFRTNDKVDMAQVEKRNIQYLYSANDIYEFMDSETYDQIPLHRDQLGNVINYLKENIEVTALIYKNKIITLEGPIFIDLKVTSTEPGIRGDTSRAGTKPAKTESGATILVPLFVNEGDVIRVDTRTGEYVSRVK